jgi:hypothetical protein
MVWEPIASRFAIGSLCRHAVHLDGMARLALTAKRAPVGSRQRAGCWFDVFWFDGAICSDEPDGPEPD